MLVNTIKIKVTIDTPFISNDANLPDFLTVFKEVIPEYFPGLDFGDIQIDCFLDDNYDCIPGPFCPECPDFHFCSKFVGYKK